MKALMEVGPEMLAQGLPPEKIIQLAEEALPPVVSVDDFDIHEVHIETHNRFRMSQEYETLPDAVKEQFEKHVAWHQQMGGAIMEQQLMSQMPPEIAAEDEAAAGGDPSGSMGPTPPQGPPPGAPA